VNLDGGISSSYTRYDSTDAEILFADVREETMTGFPKTIPSSLRAAPNLLTLLRICMTPFLVATILEGDYAWSFGLFVVAGLTDALDGALARLLKQRTVLGQYLDPVADKLLLSTLFLVLTYEGLIPTRVTALVFGRDLGILAVAAILHAASGRREFKPSFLGKANTLIQICAIAVVLLERLITNSWLHTACVITLDATMILTVISGLHYAWLVSRRTSPAPASGNVAK
jgi:cardiolipin synthase (CMP-forming)